MSPNVLLKFPSRLAKFGCIFSNPEAEICFKCAISPRAEIGVDGCVGREDVLEGQNSSRPSCLYHCKEQFGNAQVESKCLNCSAGGQDGYDSRVLNSAVNSNRSLDLRRINL